jgi:hypothetical protein
VTTETGRKNLLALAHTAQSFGTRPARLLGLLDPVAALDLDTAAAYWLSVKQAEDMRAAREGNEDATGPTVKVVNLNDIISGGAKMPGL